MRSERARLSWLAALIFGFVFPCYDSFAGDQPTPMYRSGNGLLLPIRGETSAPPPNADAVWRKLVAEFPEDIDRVTLVSLNTPMPTRDDIGSADALDRPMTRHLTDAERDRVVELMKRQLVDCRPQIKKPPACHEPEYELSYQHGTRELLRASFSWKCDSIFLYGAEPARCRFRAEKDFAPTMQLLFGMGLDPNNKLRAALDELSMQEQLHTRIQTMRVNVPSPFRPFLALDGVFFPFRGLIPALPGAACGKAPHSTAHQHKPVIGTDGARLIPRVYMAVHGAIDHESIRRVVRSEKLAINSCMSKCIDLPWDVWSVVRFTVGPTGEVIASGVDAATQGTLPVAQCIAAAVWRFPFPAPEYGFATVTYPFRHLANFELGEGGEPACRRGGR